MKIELNKKEINIIQRSIYDRLEGAINTHNTYEIKYLKIIQKKLKEMNK